MAPVIEQLDRFADELEFDLHAHCGLDLLEFFAGGYTWAKLDRLADQLPWWSRYKLAIEDDADIAARHLDAEAQQPQQQTPAPRPSIQEWDPYRDLTALITDGFNRLVHAQGGKKGSKPPKQVPRPETARDRLRRQREYATVSELFEIFTPGR